MSKLGLLKVLCTLERRTLPRHTVSPRAEFTRGPIIVPISPAPLHATRLIAQVNSFGFTGSICSMIIESPAPITSSPPNAAREERRFFLPFSAKTESALSNQVVAVCSWALKTNCSLADLAAILGLCRDHHTHRRSASVVSSEDLIRLRDAHSAGVDEQSGNVVAFPDDDRINRRLLNLGDGDKSMRDGLLDELIQSGHLIDAAMLLYNRGHPLDFSTAYDKRDIDMTLLRTLPLYPFDRQRYWRDELPHRSTDSLSTIELGCPIPKSRLSISSSDANSPDSSSKQKEFISLIEQFGAPISLDDSSKIPREDGTFHILLTGGNGMLGSNLLSRLLHHKSTTVYCIVRGDSLAKLSRSFKIHHLDERLLLTAMESGSLILLPTSDLCGPKLGLTDTHYQQLVESVDRIVHAAWKVNFNLPLKEFIPFLKCTRALAELSLTAKKLVQYFFIGTYASTFNYPDKLVPEDILEPRVSFAAAQVRHL